MGTASTIPSRPFFAGLLLIIACAVPAAAHVTDAPDGDTITLSDKDIAALNVRTIQALLNLLPGVNAGSTSVSIRGDTAVAVFMDGLSLINMSTSRRTIQWDLVPLETIASIKIIKGGGAVAFGDNSGGGVILITTKRLESTQARVELSAGNQAYRRARANASFKGGDWGLGINGDYYATDGYRINGDTKQVKAGFKLSWAPEAWLNLAGPDSAAPTLAVDYGETRKGSPGLPGYETPHARSRADALGASLNCKALGWKNTTTFSHFQNDYNNPDSGLITELRTWMIKEDLRKGFTLPYVGLLSTGLMFSHSHAQGNKMAPKGEQSYSVFALKSYKLQAVPVTLNLGLRINAYSEYDTAINPAIKASFSKGIWMLEAAFQMTNNTPTFRQRYFETSSTIPNPDLGMERANNYSLAVNCAPLNWLRFSATPFYNQVNDRITYMRGNQGVGKYENVGHANLSGVDAAISFTPFAWLSFQPSYTYLMAINEDSDLWLSGKPRHKFKADLVLRPFEGLMFGIEGNYSSKVYTNAANTAWAPSYFTVDLRGEYNIGSASLFFRADNLFDEDYLRADGYPAPPLTWLVGMAWEF